MTYSPYNPPRSAFGEILSANLYPAFNIQFPYGLMDELVVEAETSTGTVTVADNALTVQTGTGVAGKATARTVPTLRYLTGMGGDVRFAGWFTGTPVANNVRYVGYGDPDLDDGWFFGYQGTTFGILHRRGGAQVSWIPQASWNRDVMDGTGPSGQTHTPTLNNVYKIDFQWLGAGDVNFYCKSTAGDRAYTLVHTLEYSGTSTAVSIANPSLPITLYAENTGSTTDTGMKFPSLGAFVQGLDANLGLPRSYDESVANVGSTEEVLFTLQNRDQFYSVNNRVPIIITALGASTYDNQSSTQGVIRLVRLPTSVTGTASFSDLDTNRSVAEIDSVVSARTGGIELAALPFGPASDSTRDLLNRRILVQPGEALYVTGEFSANTNVWAALEWRELF